MSDFKFTAPKSSAVPHYLPKGSVVDPKLIQHFDQMMADQQGFCVIDFTGTLTRQICKRVPKERAKDTCVLDFSYPDRVFSANLLQGCDTVDIANQADSAVEVLQAVCKGDLTSREQEFLRLSCHALLAAALAAEKDKYQDFFAQTYSLVLLWGFAGFRRFINTYLEDVTLKKYWQNFNPNNHKQMISALGAKLAFLFDTPQSLTVIQGPSLLDFNQVKAGKMFFIDVSTIGNSVVKKENLTQWKQYVASVFIQQYYQSVEPSDVAETRLFVSAANTYKANTPTVPEGSIPAGSLPTLAKYAALKYGRKNKFVEAELGSIATPETNPAFRDFVGQDFQMPPHAYTEIITCQ